MKKALSLAEILIALAVIAVLALIMVPVLSDSFDEYTDKVSAIKANNSIKEVINNLLSGNQYYVAGRDLSYNINNANETHLYKFQTAFLSYLILPRRISCQIAYARAGNAYVGDSSECYTGNDNITWGIPKTDFKTINVVYVANENNAKVPYVPVTVYVNYDITEAYTVSNGRYIPKADASASFYSRAIVYGVRADGKLIFLDNVIDRATYPNVTHYQAQEYITKR